MSAAWSCEKVNCDRLCKKEKAANPSWSNRICWSRSRQQTHGTHCPGCVGANGSWRAWARPWMRKFTGNYLMGKNDIHFRKCPELFIMQNEEDCERITRSACPLPQAARDAAAGKSCSGSWSDPVPTFLHPSLSMCLSPKDQLCLVSLFHPVSTASHQGTMMPLGEKVLLAHSFSW